jgi:hypothetical protein
MEAMFGALFKALLLFYLRTPLARAIHGQSWLKQWKVIMLASLFGYA